MGRGIRRDRDGLDGADRIIHCGAPLVPVVAHRDVVGMIIVVHVRDRKSPLVFFGRMESNGVGFLRHVLADDPHPGHVGKLLERACVVTSPGARVQERGRERQPERNGLHLKSAGKTSLGI